MIVNKQFTARYPRISMMPGRCEVLSAIATEKPLKYQAPPLRIVIRAEPKNI
jgi:hypothetical protein